MTCNNFGQSVLGNLVVSAYFVTGPDEQEVKIRDDVLIFISSITLTFNNFTLFSLCPFGKRS